MTNKSKRVIVGLSTALSLTGYQAAATSISTSELAAVNAFQVGATVLGFDNLTPNGSGGAGSGNTGVAIDPAAQLTDQFAAQGITFSSDGGPVGVVSVEGLSNEADARSPFNLIGGSTLSGMTPVLDYRATITLTFDPAFSVTKVGAWNDPTGSTITLSTFDVGGDLIESVEAFEGDFLGITNIGIASATFALSNPSSLGFSLDDVTFSATNVSTVPLPATGLLLATGIGALFTNSLRRRRRRSKAPSSVVG